MSAVFVQAISEGICSADPAATVAKALRPARKKTRQPALLDLADLRELLRTAEASGASPVTKVASRLLALSAVRPGAIRGAEWTEFEGIDWNADDAQLADAPLWRIPASRMKVVMERKDDEAYEHIVPLSRSTASCGDVASSLFVFPMFSPAPLSGAAPSSSSARRAGRCSSS
jgi:integrase